MCINNEEQPVFVLVETVDKWTQLLHVSRPILLFKETHPSFLSFLAQGFTKYRLLLPTQVLLDINQYLKGRVADAKSAHTRTTPSYLLYLNTALRSDLIQPYRWKLLYYKQDDNTCNPERQKVLEILWESQVSPLVMYIYIQRIWSAFYSSSYSIKPHTLHLQRYSQPLLLHFSQDTQQFCSISFTGLSCIYHSSR